MTWHDMTWNVTWRNMKHCSDLNILVSGMARLGWRLEKVTTLPRLLLLLSPGPHSDLTIIPPMLTRMLQLVLTQRFTQDVDTNVDTDVDLLLLLLPPCPQSALHCPVSPRCRPAPAPAIASRRYLKLGVFVFVATNNFPSKSEKMDICWSGAFFVARENGSNMRWHNTVLRWLNKIRNCKITFDLVKHLLTTTTWCHH